MSKSLKVFFTALVVVLTGITLISCNNNPVTPKPNTGDQGSTQQGGNQGQPNTGEQTQPNTGDQGSQSGNGSGSTTTPEQPQNQNFSLSQVTKENVGQTITVKALVVAVHEGSNKDGSIFDIFLTDKDGQYSTYIHSKGSKDAKFVTGSYLQFSAEVANFLTNKKDSESGIPHLSSPTNIEILETNQTLPARLTQLSTAVLNDAKNQSRIVDAVSVQIKVKNGKNGKKLYSALIDGQQVKIFGTISQELTDGQTVTFRNISISQVKGQGSLKVYSFTTIE